MAPDVEGMPGDARDHFVHHPTYLALGILALYELRAAAGGGYGGGWGLPEGFLDVAGEGLCFATLRGLWGHGYDGPFVRQATVRVLARGRVGCLIRELQGRPGATGMLELLQGVLQGTKAEMAEAGDGPIPLDFQKDVRPLYEGIVGSIEAILRDALP